MDDGYYYGFSMATGTLLWTSQLPSYPWGVFGSYTSESAYGLLFECEYDGVVAYNWTNGQVAWHFEAPAIDF